MVARVAFLLAGGVWADRLRRQYVMLAADGLRGVVQAMLAILLLTGYAHVREPGAGASVYGAATSFFNPASMGLVPETVPAAQLQQANSLLGLGLSRSVPLVALAWAVFGWEVFATNCFLGDHHAGADPRPGTLSGRLLRLVRLPRDHALGYVIVGPLAASISRGRPRTCRPVASRARG